MNDFTPSASRPWQTRDRSSPSAANSATARLAPVEVVAQRAAGLPWSMNASSVAGGTVSTVSAPDQRVDVVGVRVARVLGARRRPQQALRARAGGGQLASSAAPRSCAGRSRTPSWRWRWPSLPSSASQRAASVRAPPRAFSLSSLSQTLSTRDTKKLATDASPSSLPPGGDAVLEARQVRLDHLLVLQQREDQRDVDAHPLGGQRADRRDPLGRRRHLDHDVGAPDRGAPAAAPPRRSCSVVGRQLGQHLQRDAPVDAAALLEDAAAAGRRRRGCPRSPAARRSRSSSGPRPTSLRSASS